MDHGLECGQEVVVKESEVILFFDINLNELEDVFSQSFHWLQHLLNTKLSIFNTIIDAPRIEFVHIDQIVEDLAQVSNIDLSNT